VPGGLRTTREPRATGRIAVGHTIWTLSDGGMERGLLNLVNGSCPDDFQHVILCLGEAGPLAHRVVAPNCRVIALNKRPGNDVTLPLKLATVSRRLRLDVLHARGWPTLVETAVAGYVGGVRRTVYGFHGKTVAELARKRLPRRLAEVLVPRLYDRIVTLTNGMRADVAREYRLDEDRVRVIPNGVDIDVFRPSDRRRELRAEFALPLDDLIIGNVARLDPVKNHTVMLRALTRLRESGAAPLLVLIGEGLERHRLEREIRELRLEDRVRLLGHSDQVPKLLNCLDVYVQSSLYEGFSNTVLEAMACGLPVVATRTGGTGDILRDGEDGYLFEPADAEGLASLIRGLTALDKRRAVGASARRRVVDNYPLPRMIRAYEELYRDLASPGRVEGVETPPRAKKVNA
jgi:sugar transferase (PEP-CTERM/EpsH1 system associated)